MEEFRQARTRKWRPQRVRMVKTWPNDQEREIREFNAGVVQEQ